MCPVKLMGLHSTEGIAPDAGLCPVKVDRSVWSKKYASGSLLETTGRWGFSVRSVLSEASGQFYRSVRSASRPLKSDEQHLKQGTRGVNHVTGR